MVKADSMLRFEFAAPYDFGERANGYGAGMLFLNGTPFWFSNSEENPKPVSWTWVDFLEHLAENWSALIVEQSYPFTWLDQHASHPGEMWEKAELRWSIRGDTVADVEEPLLFAFHHRHNLSAGWKGISLPGLYWLRVGNSVWLSPEDRAPIRASFADCATSLETMGNKLAEAYAGSNNLRVAAAVQAWNNRKRALRDDFFTYSTGLTSQQLTVIEHGSPRAQFWGVTEWDSWELVAANDSELLAAARMTRGILEPTAIASLVEIVRRAPRYDSPYLDAVGIDAVRYLETLEHTYAHESGYRLAEWFRNRIELKIGEPFDVEKFLSSLGVPIVIAQFGSDHIEALACFNSPGSCIILNDDRAYAHSKHRLRMTLAHELCHFLVDRAAALPMAEVLGGGVDSFVERRASAFAAELLLPRAATVIAREKGEMTLQGKLRFLQDQFQVSKRVACAQIFNGPELSFLTSREREYLNRILHGDEGRFLNDEKIISEVA